MFADIPVAEDCFPFGLHFKNDLFPYCSSRWTGNLFRKMQNGRSLEYFVSPFSLGIDNSFKYHKAFFSPLSLWRWVKSGHSLPGDSCIQCHWSKSFLFVHLNQVISERENLFFLFGSVSFQFCTKEHHLNLTVSLAVHLG